MIKLNSKTSELRLVTPVASDIRVSYSARDTNKGTFKIHWVGGKILPPITVAGTTTLVKPPKDVAIRQIEGLAMHNSGVDSQLILEEFDGVDVIERFNRILLAGETAEFDDIQGWVIYDAVGLKKPAVA